MISVLRAMSSKGAKKGAAGLARSSNQQLGPITAALLIQAATHTTQAAIDDEKRELITKYGEKLQKKAESEGISVDQLLERMKQQQRQNATHAPQTATATSSTGSKAKESVARRRSSGPFKKPLDEIVKVDLLQNENAEKISEIWNMYFGSKADTLCGVMEAKFYKQLLERGKWYPIFVLPYPRDDGYELFVLQFFGDQVYFTTLLEFQTFKENAPPLLVLSHYNEFSESKGIVLMKGDCADAKRLNASEARTLVYLLQMYYATGGQKKFKLVEEFHNSPTTFDYKALISETESLSLGS
ncbi:ATP11 protein-domain-containing protein [Cladochytrium replicatum]|nr:ATP11 protein-domain-containing protein [Cladochytrium replicatum]